MKNTTVKPAKKAAKKIKVTKKAAGLEGVKRTALFFENPTTGNPVCYQRAHQLGLLKKKVAVPVGIKNPKTGLMVSIKRALQLHLLPKKALLKHAA